MEQNLPFCDIPSKKYNTTDTSSDCNYDLETVSDTQTSYMYPALGPIYGTVIDINVIQSDQSRYCVSYIDLTLQSTDNEMVHFFLSANTYFVDCIPIEVGTKLIGFYDSATPIPASYPPKYQIAVLALDLPGRFIKADFFDCFLMSQDYQLQLLITNNTYVVDTHGNPYCGNISQKYMVVLFDEVTESNPAKTKPNVVIVL